MSHIRLPVSFRDMKKVRFKEMLSQLIKEKGVSAREVARTCEIPQSTLNNYLAGRDPQKPEHLLALSKYFKVSIEFLLSGSDERRPTLEDVLTTEVFDGWLRVKIERAIPNKRKFNTDGES